MKLNVLQPVVIARYTAHLLGLILGAAVALLVKGGGSFAPLATAAFGVSVAVLVAGWLITILGIFASTGDVPVDPPAVVAPPMPVMPVTYTTSTAHTSIEADLRRDLAELEAKFRRIEHHAEPVAPEPPAPPVVPAAPAAV